MTPDTSAMKFRTRRRPTDFAIVLIAESGEYDVFLRDVSETGIKVSGIGRYVYPDAEIQLVIRKQRLPGRIKWVDQDVAGIELTSPFPSEIADLVLRINGTRPANSRWR